MIIMMLINTAAGLPQQVILTRNAQQGQAWAYKQSKYP
jgi:hypothetical protein